MANLHGFWINCLHCPAVFIIGIGVLLISFCAFLVSAASLCCKGQSDRVKTQPDAINSASGCKSDVPHVVF